MKKIKQYHLIILLVAAFVASCDDSSTGNDDPEPETESHTVEDLFAEGTRINPEARFILFSLRTGETVDIADSASTNWDIGFRGTDVILNSGTSGPGNAGAVVLDVPFNQVEMAPADGYSVDTEEEAAISGWYTYTGNTPPVHAVIPHEDVTIVLRTADGNYYAKLEIISYYQGNPDTSTEEFANTDTRAESPYYTFRYAIQLEENVRDLN